MSNLKNLYEAHWQHCLFPSEQESKENTINEIFESIVPIFHNGKRCLDVGCGDGQIVKIVRDKFSEIHGCDISIIALNEAKKAGMLTVCSDLNDGYIPYKDNLFDYISALEVLEHVWDPFKLIKEIRRILKPGGRLILTTPNIRYFRNIHTLIFRGSFPHTSTDSFVWGGGHVHYFTRKDLIFLFSHAGFEDLKFYINEKQFARSWKRRFIRRIIGTNMFGEHFCGSIALEAVKR